MIQSTNRSPRERSRPRPRSTRQSRKSRRNRIHFEQLEERCLLATFTVNSTADLSDANTGDGLCDVDLMSGGDQCTLRAAIALANASANTDSSGDGLPDPDVIRFDIPAGDTGHFYYRDDNDATPGQLNGQVTPANITATTATSDAAIGDIDSDWPHSWWSISSSGVTVTEAVSVDGYTQSEASANTNTVESRLGLNTVLRVEVRGAAGSVNGLTVLTGETTVRGLAINSFSGRQIFLNGADSNDCVIEGNFIGTDVAGTIAPAGNVGVFIQQSGATRLTDNTIGGTTAAARNLISSRNGQSINLFGVDRTVIQGNLIGTDRSGTAGLVVGGATGVSLNFGLDNRIGGTVDGAGNLISAHTLPGESSTGISISNASGNVVQGNLIGTDVTGRIALGNRSFGVRLGGGGTSNIIGGDDDDDGSLDGVVRARNVISANGLAVEATIFGTVVQGNLIGTDVTSTVALGNTDVALNIASSGNLIGGTMAGAGNVIANNAGGVLVQGGTGNAILGNFIFSSSVTLGINLAGGSNNPCSSSASVTCNDAGDGDAGVNNLQNFPVLTAATSNGLSTTIAGTLNSEPNRNMLVEFFANTQCDPSGFGEGQRFLGRVTLQTDAGGDVRDASGNLGFSVSLPGVGVADGEKVTATATDVTPFDHDGNPATPDVPRNNTSEFSQCLTAVGVTNNPPTITSNGGDDTAMISVAENTTAVTDVDATDPDPGASLTFGIVPIGPDQSLFSIDATTGELRFDLPRDFETPGDGNTDNVYAIQVQVTDGSLTDTQAIAVTVTNVNEQPDGLALLENPIVPENSAAGTVISAIVTHDSDAGDTLSLTLTDSAGGRFAISGNDLVVGGGAPLDFEVATSHTVTIRATDSGGLFIERSFDVTVENVPEAPTDLMLDNPTVNENAAGALVGKFSASDPDGPPTPTFSLPDTSGPFDISGDRLMVKNGSLLDFESSTSHTVRVRATDATGLFVERDFTVMVLNVNEAPTDITLSNSSVDENSPAGTVIGTLSAVDPDAGDSHTFAVLGSSPSGASFAIDATSQLVVAAGSMLDFETTTSYSVRIQATDQAGSDLSFDRLLTITVYPVDEPPVVTSNSPLTVNEGSTAPLPFQATDPDTAPGQLVYTLASAPSLGSILVQNQPIAAGGTFTQSQVTQGVVTYMHDGSETLTDSFNFSLTDGVSSAATNGEFSITVTPVNDPPVANSSGVSVSEESEVVFGLDNLGNDTESPPNQLAFTITALPIHGTLLSGVTPVAVNQSFVGPPTLVYVPETFSLTTNSITCFDLPANPDAFSYVVTDPEGLSSNEATFSFTIMKAVADAAVTLTLGILRVGGTAGNDTIKVQPKLKGGAPVLEVTRITDGASMTSTFPNPNGTAIAEIRIWGREGNDFLDASLLQVPVKLIGGAGNDELRGGKAGDRLVGGAGDDVLYAWFGANSATATDILDGCDGDDSLSGHIGGSQVNLIMNGGPGTDNVNQLGGVFTILVQTNEGEFDFVSSISGNRTSTLEIIAGTGPVTLNTLNVAHQFTKVQGHGQPILGNGNANKFDLGDLVISDVPFVDTGAGDDTVLAKANEAEFDTMSGGGGTNDLLDFVDVTRPHSLDSFGGNNVLNSSLIEVINGHGQPIVGNAGNNTLNFSGVTFVAVRFVDGGLGNDNITGTAGSDTLIGGPGNDTVTGGGGDDVLIGGVQNDRLFGQSGRELLIGGAGTDSLDGGADDDILLPGTSAFTNPAIADAALASIMAEWTRTDADYTTRVNHLRSGGGLNGTSVLNATTVIDDSSVDALLGGLGSDWFFAHLVGGTKDTLTDRLAAEFVDVI